MVVETIFLDESGYTGEDLLNPDQPVFALGSVHAREETCIRLKREYFASVQSAELKYGSLRKRRRQQDAILAFMREVATDERTVRVCFVHKRYALVAQMVNLLVEPAAHAVGHDLYKRGENIALTNLMFYALPTLTGAAYVDGLLAKFQQMVRSRSQGAANSFFTALDGGRFGDQAEELLDYYRIARPFFPARWSAEVKMLDVTVPMAVVLMANWSSVIGEDIDLVHDASSPMAASRWIWDAIMDPGLGPAQLGYDRRKLRFPIGVGSTTPTDSHGSAGVQLADLIAGAVAGACAWTANGQDAGDYFGQRLAALLDRIYVSDYLWPSPVVTSNELGTVGEAEGDLLGFISRLIQQQRGNQGNC